MHLLTQAPTNIFTIFEIEGLRYCHYHSC